MPDEFTQVMQNSFICECSRIICGYAEEGVRFWLSASDIAFAIGTKD